MKKTLTVLLSALLFAGSVSAETGETSSANANQVGTTQSLAQKMGITGGKYVSRTNRTALMFGFDVSQALGGYIADTALSNKTGLGGTISFVYYVDAGNKIGITASLGYNAFQITTEKSTAVKMPNGSYTYVWEYKDNLVQSVPMNLGVRYNFLPYLYAGVEFGYARHIVDRLSAPGFIENDSSTTDYVQTGSFTWSPAIGGVVKMGGIDLDLSVRARYMSFPKSPLDDKSLNYVGARVALSIPMGKH
ncbi:MAG: hypothetical protein V4543_02445 [Bacteroidota bacterium]